MTLHRTYDPHRPEWASDTPVLASAHERDWYGLLVESGAKTAAKRLVVLCAGQDAQEQAGHKPLRYMVDELLSGSILATKLLRSFSFLVVPFISQQAIRDGFSRFPYDVPAPPGQEGNTLANGNSTTGGAVIQRAIDNWVSDHPDPTHSVFCVMTLHTDVVNRTLTASGVKGDSTTPTSPYGYIQFPGHETDADGGASYFRDALGGGFDAAGWSEFFRGANIIRGGYGIAGVSVSGYGGTSFYFEQPWRHAGNKASFFYRQDAMRNFASAVLSGIATVAGSVLVIDGDAVLSGSGTITASGQKIVGGTASLSGTGTITAAGRKIQTGSASLSATGTITAAGKKVIASAVGLSGTGRIIVTALKFGLGAASLSGVGAISAFGERVGATTVTHLGTATLSGAGTITAAGRKVYTGAVALSGSGQIAALGEIKVKAILQGAAALAGLGRITAAGTRVGEVDFSAPASDFLVAALARVGKRSDSLDVGSAADTHRIGTRCGMVDRIVFLGDDEDIYFVAKDANGKVVDLTGATLYCDLVAESGGNRVAAAGTQIDDAAKGLCRARFSSAQTAALADGMLYRYDGRIVTRDGNRYTIGTGWFRAKAPITPTP